MSWYKQIEDKLKNCNDTDISIEIDDIDKEYITFCVYDEEVTTEVIEVIEEVLTFIKKGDINLWQITHYPSKSFSAECFNLTYKIDIGEDTEEEEPINSNEFNNMSRGGGNNPSL